MPYSRELTTKEKRAICKLVISSCANYDREYGCLPLDGSCYMFGVGFVDSGLCKYFRQAVLPLDPGLDAIFSGGTVKACKRCGKAFPVAGRKAYCSGTCADAAGKEATARRVRKHRSNRQYVTL